MLSELFSYLAKEPNTTNALAAVASAIAATFAVVVSGIAVCVSYLTLKHQQRHNVLSVRPIPIVTVADYEDAIRVKVRNHGSGPMLVKRVQVVDGTSVKESLVEWMPDLPDNILWGNFVGPVSDRSLLPGSEMVLLELNGDHEDKAFRSVRDTVRKALAPLTVVVTYTDIYESSLDPYMKDLTWFGRHEVGRYPE
ncbi:MAG: hypothetical protein ACKVQT_36155 [Burkholderiales bacterium]